MEGKDIVKMSKKELRRIGLIHKLMDKVIKQEEAGSLLGLTSRQIRRMVKRVKSEGDIGIIHGNRGRESNHKISKKIRKKVIKIYEQKYRDFGPTLAVEKLEERDAIRLSDETLRKWLLEEGIWEKRRKIKVHRQWRERKGSFGEMVQVDGSHHDWLEGRGPKMVLMGYMDDATGRAFGRFYAYEGTLPALESFMRYTKKNGIVQTVYVDRHTTYKSPKKNLWDNEKALSQFEEALERLGVRVIHAGSPQAKGRIERLFRTLQDRLVKEMRLAKVKSQEEANRFIEKYLPRFNKRFEKEPKSQVDLHREIPEGMKLVKELSIREGRTLRNDNTVRYDGKFYQLEKGWTRRPKGVVIEQWVDGTLHMTDGSQELKYRVIEETPKKEITLKVKGYFHRARVPSQDHPWRGFRLKGSPTTLDQKKVSLDEIKQQISNQQGSMDTPNLNLSTYPHNSQREKKVAKKRERTTAFFLLQKQQQNQN